MAIFVKQDEPRKQLNVKVSAELATRLNKRAMRPGDTDQAVIMDRQRKTTSGGIFWAVILSVVLVAVFVYLIFIF